MSVLACDRTNCDNVMCDRYSHKHGYLCNECFSELVDLGPSVCIATFMKSIKQFEPNKSLNAQKVYDAEFPVRHEEHE